jgi:uncharacterized OB-fold protein
VPTYRGMSLVVQETDSEHRGYFEAAGRGEFVVQRCSACSMLRGAPGAACPFCMASDWEWFRVSGKGVIYSYQIVEKAVHPAFADWVPYPIVLVELDEQRSIPWRNGREGETVSVRVMTNLCRPEDPMQPEKEENVAIGKRVEVSFIQLGDGLAIPQFCLSDEPAEVAPWRAS